MDSDGIGMKMNFPIWFPVPVHAQVLQTSHLHLAWPAAARHFSVRLPENASPCGHMWAPTWPIRECVSRVHIWLLGVTEKCPFKFTQRPFMWKPGFWSAGNLQAAICVPHVKPRRRASNWLRKFIKYYITFPFGLFPLKKDIPIAQNHALYSPCFSLPPSSLLLSNIWTYLDPQIFPREWQTMKEFTPLFDASNWFHKVCSWPASHARVTNKITKWMTCNHHVITCNQHKKL